jgi:hypothetical protein
VTIALAECDTCGARMPLREAFTTEALLASALSGPRVRAMEGPCTCGGTLQEDLSTTLAAIREVLRDDGL